MFGAHNTKSPFDWAAAATEKSTKPVVVAMVLACHTEERGTEKTSQGMNGLHMRLPDNERNDGGRKQVDFSETLVLEIIATDNDSFRYSLIMTMSCPKRQVRGTMALHMNVLPGQVVQWKTYQKIDSVGSARRDILKVKTHWVFVGCITPSSESRTKDIAVKKDIYPIVLEINMDRYLLVGGCWELC